MRSPKKFRALGMCYAMASFFILIAIIHPSPGFSLLITGDLTVSDECDEDWVGISLTLGGGGQTDEAVELYATAIGIGDMDDDNEIIIISTLGATAACTLDGYNIDLNLGGATHVDATITSLAEAAGIQITGEPAFIENAGGIIDVSAEASIGSGTISLGLMDGSSAAVDRSSVAAATGIACGPAGDEVVNNGRIRVSASAETDAAGVSGEFGVLEGAPNNRPSVSKTSTKATASAAGISGGAGQDVIRNGDGGEIEVSAEAEADAVNVQLTLSGDTAGNVGGQAISDSSASADAMAIGIDGGAGIDEITNRGAILGDVDANATAVGAVLDITITNEGDASGAALSDASVMANAAARGIDGGLDSDIIDNGGNIELLSNSDASGVAVSLDVAGTVKGNAEGSSVSDASVTATSMASGISGGEGDDAIVNDGRINLMDQLADQEDGLAGAHDASATAVSVSMVISGTMDGNVAGEAISDSSALAEARAVGIDGGGGDDRIDNWGTVVEDVSADATAEGVGTSVGIVIAREEEAEGSVSGAALSDASVTAVSAASGISGGDGDDAIANRGDMELLSSSEATGVSVGLTVAGTMRGDAEGKALSGSSAKAVAMAIGIDGGSGIDTITNRGAIVGNVDASAKAVGVALDIGITKEGEATGAALSDASVTANAMATGIDSGGDGDFIDNRENGEINLSAVSTATGVAVSLDVAGTMAGDAGGSSVSDASATANAEATGIDGAGGVDDITNSVDILADASADATSVSVSLGVAGSVMTESDAEVDITGEALSDASATANAVATGIAGGMGGDTVDNQGHLDLSSASEATGVAVGVDISGKVSLNKGEDDEEAPESEDGETDDRSTVSGKALSDASATANAGATGIEGGAGMDDITNRAAIVADAIADADAVSVSLGVAVDVTTNSDAEVDITGEALSDARATANAAAAGIAGGDDDDTIVNTGTITLMERNDTDASAMGVAVGLDVSGKVSLNNSKEDGEAPEAVVSEDEESDAKDMISGKAVSSSGATAKAVATGIDGGGGVDDITNTADILADVGADATAVSVSLGVAGSVTTNSDSEVDITGAALSDASATANAVAKGIDGGAGNDTIGNQGCIDLASDSDATGVAASLSIAGTVTSKGDTEAEVEGFAVSDTSVTANATATGIDGGAGGDTITNETVDGVENAGTIRLGAISDATGVSASLGVTTAVAINGDAKADVAGSTVSDASVTANSLATGISGGEGGDNIDNEGYIDLYSDSSATGVAAGVNFTSVVSIKGDTDAEVTGEAVSDTTVDAHASAIGIDGGGGIDTIGNSGDMDLLATADALGVAASLDVTGSLSFKGVAKSDVTGAVASKSSVTATAAATGIDGGGSGDKITNTGAITIMDGDAPDAVATAVAASLSVAANASIKGVSTGTVSGTALSEAITVVDATATGIDGGAGDDIIDNEGAINLLPNSDATSVAASLNVSVGMSGSAEGSALGDASVRANAAATGIDGGEGEDTITNEGAITLMGAGEDEDDATALGVAASLNISGNVIGTTEGKALSEASVTADAAANGIEGGADADTITNTGKISADVDSHANGVSAAADVTVAGDGTAAGLALSEASVTANAAATGIDGGDGDDTIVNETDDEIDGSGEIELFATSDAAATAVSVSIAGAMNGAAEGGALSKAGVVSDAVAVGIDGGGGVDTIENRSGITGEASSTADATSVSVGITVGVHGKADGEALSDASATALGTAIGINGGDGVDSIENEGLIDMAAISSASATTVSVQLAGSMGGVAKGKAMTDGSAEAISHAAGIDGGDGDDVIDSSMNDIITYAESTADSESVSVSLAGSVGLASGASIADASAIGAAYAAGIDGGPGHDTIENGSDIEVVSNATAEATSTSVAVALGVGVVGGIGVGNSSATAVAESAGISGAERDVQSIATTDSTAGSTTLVDQSLIPAEGEPPSDIVGKRIQLSGGDSGNFVTLVEAFDPETGEITLADALPNDLSKGDEYTLLGNGSAEITNSGMLEPGAEAHATAGSTTVSVGIGAGFSEGEASADASAIAKAIATGIRGGSGDDRIDNDGEISVGANPEGAKVLAEAEGTSETVKVDLTLGANEGSAASNSSATAVTVASGISSGLGDDWIENTKAIAVGTDGTDDRFMAIATAASETIDVGVTLGMTVGEVSSDASATAKAASTAIDSGSGDDWIDNSGPVEVASNSRAFASGKTRSVKMTLGKSNGVSRSDAATLSQAFATGIDAGGGEDEITTEGEMTVKAFSEALATSSAKGVNALSIGSSSQSAAADSSATADAVAQGIDGGAGGDTIGVGGTLDVNAQALVGAVSRSAAVTGFAVGSDLQQSEAGASTGATTLAVGIDGGEGDDDIINDAAMTLNAGSNVAVGCYSEATQGLNLVGESNAEATADASTSVATAGVGIAGGQGFDDIQTNGAISVTSASNADVTSVSKVESNTFIGSASAKAASDASAQIAAYATGIDGGDGGGEITGNNAISAFATSYGKATATSEATADVTFGSASTSTAAAAGGEATAVATGIITDGMGDDVVRSLDAIDATAEATLDFKVESVSVSETTFGDAYAASAADASTLTSSTANGIAVGDGTNVVENEGTLSASATSHATVDIKSVSLCDSTFGDGFTVATSSVSAVGESVASGIEGGDGVDTMTNTGSIAVAAGGNLTVNALTVSSDGPASSDSRTRALARAVGIDAAGGSDTITNTGDVLVTASPRILSANRTFGSGGNVSGLVGIDLSASAKGITSGSGNDTITNQGDLLVLVGRQTTSEITEDSASGSNIFMDNSHGNELIGKWIRFELEGAPDLFAVVESFDETTGEFTLRDPLQTDLQAGSAYTIFDMEDDAPDIGLGSVTVGGRLFVDASTTASVLAAGIEASDGEDSILNTAGVRVKARNNVQAGELKVGAIIEANMRTESKVESIGIAGDSQSHVTKPSVDISDQLIDEDRIGEDQESIIGKPILIKTGGSAGFLTVAEGFDPATGAITLADSLPKSGLSIGDTYVLGGGSDQIINQGEIDVEADALLNVAGLTLSFISDVDKEGVAQTAADGIQGGEFFDNAIFNSGIITAKSSSAVVGTERAESIFLGPSSQQLSFTAQSHSEGISSGSGDDTVVNEADIEAEAVSTAKVQGVTNSFVAFNIGTRKENLVDALAEAAATGVELGDGDNIVENAGVVSAYAGATPQEDQVYLAEAISDANIGETSASAVSTTDALARGVHTQNGMDTVFNSGEIIVLAESHSTSYARASEIIPAQDQSTVTALSAADNFKFTDESVKGLDPAGLIGKRLRFPDKSDLDFLDTESTVTTLNSDNTNTFTDDSLVNASADNIIGKRLRFPTVDADFVTTVTGFEIVTSDGVQTAELTLADNIPTDTDDNPLVAQNDDYTLSVISAEILAFDSETGEFTLSNCIPDAVAEDDEYTLSIVSEVDADNNTFTDLTRIDEIAPGTQVTFPRFPDFVATVVNFDATTGKFELSDIPSGLSADDIYALSSDVSDGYSGSTATAFATGIDLGNDDAVVENHGGITVRASAISETEVEARIGTANANTRAAVEARGIATGDGNDRITNTGEIAVAAEITTTSSTDDTEESARAFGIVTGEGDDAIVNFGSISTQIVLNGADPVAGVGIQAGAGNDVVTLMAASETTGSVDLGNDDDRLNFVEGAALNGDATGGDGRDALVFYGQGAYGGTIAGFETAAKYDAGTYGLNSLPTMNALSVYDGVLQTRGGYIFDDDGSAFMGIHLDGFGQFQVADAVELGGALSVLAEPRFFHNGQIFPIIQSGRLLDSFNEVSLPETRPLLGFELNYNHDDQQVEVISNARPFRTVARNANERAIAEYLERIGTGASGEMSRVLGEFQMLQENQHGQAFAGMSPAAYGGSTGAVLQTAQQYAQVVANRMQSLQAGASAPIADASSHGLDGILLAYNGPNASLGDVVRRQDQADARRRWGAWANAFGHWTDQDADDGFVGYDSDTYGVVLGMDYAFSENWLAGASFGYSTNDISFDENAGDGDIDSYFGSFYTSWYADAFYLESVLTYGSQEFDNERNVVVGDTRYTARSDHDGTLYSAYLGGGYDFGGAAWRFGPFASLQYLYLDEDGFEETGAGVLSLIVDDRQTDALVSQLGVRTSGCLETGIGALVPELSLAWLYDFDIDDRVITSSFAGAPGDAFSITGQEVEQNGFVIGAALTLMQASGFESSLAYSGELRDGYDAHAVIGQIRFEF